MSLSITKKFRQLWRTDNGAGYRAMTEEGTELLLLGSNGSRLSHVVQGIDLDAALSLAGEPNWQQGVGDNLGEILKAQPPPHVPEPEPEPEPEPASRRNGALLGHLNRRPIRCWMRPPGASLSVSGPGLVIDVAVADLAAWHGEDGKRRVLGYAQAQGWVIVEPSSQVSKGKVHPEPVLPYRIPNDGYRSLDR